MTTHARYKEDFPVLNIDLGPAKHLSIYVILTTQIIPLISTCSSYCAYMVLTLEVLNALQILLKHPVREVRITLFFLLRLTSLFLPDLFVLVFTTETCFNASFNFILALLVSAGWHRATLIKQYSRSQKRRKSRVTLFFSLSVSYDEMKYSWSRGFRC